MTTLSVVPVASSVLRLLGTKHDTSSWRGTRHHVLQKTCCRPLCAAGQECLALLGSERPREAVGPKLREGTVLGLGERRPPPFHPRTPRGQAAAQETKRTARGALTQESDQPRVTWNPLGRGPGLKWG